MPEKSKGPKYANDNEKKISEFPNRQGGYEEIAEHLAQELENVIEENPSLNIQDEDVAALQVDHLELAKGDIQVLEKMLEDSEREPVLYEDRIKVMFYLAVARAYLSMKKAEKGSE